MNVYTSEVEMLRAQCREWEKVCNSHLRLIKKLKKERQWVGLTDEETDTEAVKEEQTYGFVQGALWAEAKLKQKNGYAEEKNT